MKNYWKQKTKIIATIGPSCASEAILQALIERGLDGARLNFSHGTHEEHMHYARTIRRLAKQMGVPVALIQDLSGPKIRLGEIAGGVVMVKRGDPYTFTTRQGIGNADVASVNFPLLPRFVKRGDALLLDDGTKRFRVAGKTDTDVHTVVEIGGEIRSHKGINLPHVKAKDVFTQKDWDDLAFGLEIGVDYVALSFVRDEKDIQQVRQFLAAHKSSAHIIAKIEKQEAVDNLDSILDVSDAIMVARGDLGIEVSIEDVPIIQKRAIHLANTKAKPVITATQMLESMTTSPTPTRAEATDVANAILDGTDATMLSGETANGDDPVRVVKTMETIARRTLDMFPYDYWMEHSEPDMSDTTAALSYASVILANRIGTKIIVALTESGHMARLISRHKPSQLIVALTPNQTTLQQLAISWGVLPIHTRAIKDLKDSLNVARTIIRQEGLLNDGDPYVVIAGRRLGDSTLDNVLLVQKV